jgi:hypothetical protein
MVLWQILTILKREIVEVKSVKEDNYSMSSSDKTEMKKRGKMWLPFCFAVNY